MIWNWSSGDWSSTPSKSQRLAATGEVDEEEGGVGDVVVLVAADSRLTAELLTVFG